MDYYCSSSYLGAWSWIPQGQHNKSICPSALFLLSAVMCIVRGSKFPLWQQLHCLGPRSWDKRRLGRPRNCSYVVCSKLFTLSSGALGKAPSKVTDALPEPEPSGAMAASEEGDDEEDEEDLEAMQSRLATLRS